MSMTPSRLLAATVPFLIVALLFQVRPSVAQNATPAAVSDPCLAAPGTWTPWPMGPGMMQTPGATGPGMMGPGMMTPGAWGPAMMSDVDLMVATMLLAHDRVDAALTQAALSRVENSDLRQLADEVVQARTSESDQLQAWRERSYPGAATMPVDQMLAMMAGMMGPMGPMMQGTPWPGMGQMPAMMGNPIAALCAASGPADGLFVGALRARDQIVLAMAGMMQPTVTDPDLQRVVQDAVSGRQRELDELEALGQGATATSPAGTPDAAAGGAGATVESYDIYFEPRELTIPAGTEVILTLPNEGVTLHNFSIDALGISVDIAPGATEQVVINAPAGTYDYYCNVPGHKEAGMVGAVTAE
jgi:uncharacterized cupredoxin-like copper-binding protein/uncharacterized protein (DUF305 family)